MSHVRRHRSARCASLDDRSSYATLPSVRIEKTDDYRDWIDALKDRVGRARILVRVERMIQGNPGQHRDLSDGVSELKVNFGPGYRVYYTQRGTRLLLLLAGGDKSTQQKDIAKAIQLARNFQE